MSGPVTLYIKEWDNWKPIATLSSSDLNPDDLYKEAVSPIFPTRYFYEVPQNEPDYSDMESTLNTLGIPLESDLEEDEE